MKKRVLIVALSVVCAMFTGCGELVEMPELSEEQEELVTEYAAGLMLKYDSKYTSKLLDAAELNKLALKEQEQREKQRAYLESASKYLENKKLAEEDSSSSSNEGNEDSSSTEMGAADSSIDNIASFYGINGFDVSYAGYEITDSYPDSGEDMFMAMDATDGHELLIVNFSVTNIEATNNNFDMFYRNPSFSVSVNGEKKIHNQATLLLDDLAAYTGEFEPNTSKNMVLVFEVDENISDINGMVLTVKGQDGKGTVVLE